MPFSPSIGKAIFHFLGILLPSTSSALFIKRSFFSSKIYLTRQQWYWGGSMTKRIKGFSVLILIMIFLLIVRLAQIQLIETKSFGTRNINLIEESVRQRTQEFVIDHGRGEFYDRNHKPLTHVEKFVLVLFPFLKELDWDVEKVAQIIQVSSIDILQAINSAKQPIVFANPDPLYLTEEQTENINQLRIPGVFAINKKLERPLIYSEQLIGILSKDGKILRKRYPDRFFPKNTWFGVTGLQRSFDEFLIQEENTKFVYHVDGKGDPLFGLNVKYVNPSNPYYPLRIITTLDEEIQKQAEKIVDQHKIKKGGLVLLDIETNTILALVSRPNINKSNPFRDDGTKNYMFSAQIPGSVFKTIIAAAAIDYDLVSPNRLFDCSKTITGEEDLKYKHGMLNFTNSFAVSCNNTFAQLAKDLMKIDPMIIETYAEKLGVLHTVGWEGDVFHFTNFKQLSDEEKGQVFLSDEERKDVNFTALTGIGQKNVRITPLAAANMMATIARNGEKKVVRAVSEIQYKNKGKLYSFPEKDLPKDKISPYTAMNLQKLLREVVKNPNGTGYHLHSLPYTVAGKSGTAETNRFVEHEQLLNKWFVGYFPFEKPKYALAVVNLDVLANEGPVIPVYRDLVNYLYEYDQKRKK